MIIFPAVDLKNGKAVDSSNYIYKEDFFDEGRLKDKTAAQRI